MFKFLKFIFILILANNIIAFDGGEGGSYGDSYFYETKIYEALIAKDNKRLIKLLQEDDQNPNEVVHETPGVSYYKCLPLDVALALKNYEAAKILIDNGFDRFDESLLLACRDLDCQAVQFLLSQEIRTTFQDILGNTALHYAVNRWRYTLPLTKLLLLAGFDENLKNKKKKSAYEINPKTIKLAKKEISQEFSKLKTDLAKYLPKDVNGIILLYLFTDEKLKIFKSCGL